MPGKETEPYYGFILPGQWPPGRCWQHTPITTHTSDGTSHEPPPPPICRQAVVLTLMDVFLNSSSSTESYRWPGQTLSPSIHSQLLLFLSQFKLFCPSSAADFCSSDVFCLSECCSFVPCFNFFSQRCWKKKVTLCVAHPFCQHLI